MDLDDESRQDEKLAMESIYDSMVFSCSNTGDSGQFSACINVPKQFCVRGRSKPGTLPQVLPIEYLSPIVLDYQLPKTYPSQSPPNFTLSCKWLRLDQISALCQQLDNIWEENRGQVILFLWSSFLTEDTFTFLQLENPLDLDKIITHVSKSSNTFSHGPCLNNMHCSGADSLQKLQTFDSRAVQDIASQDLVLPFVVEYDRSTRQEIFKSQMFSCLVCLSEKLGSDCIAIGSCHHVFCKECITHYLELHIKEGNVMGLKCPTDKCDSQILQSQVRALVTAELFARYDRLLFQISLDQMTDIIYCPRKMCGSAVLLDSDSQMAECSVCCHVFCKLCRAVYHGVAPCAMPAEERDAIVRQFSYGTEEEKAILIRRYGRQMLEAYSADRFTQEWLEKNSKKCPNCNTPIQKIDGCNKMVCMRCHCYFCWLCMMVLPKGNPYSHYREAGGSCANKLFEGMVTPEDDEEEEDFVLDVDLA